jgi:sulfite reductase alpha subunit-like flavoprotein
MMKTINTQLADKDLLEQAKQLGGHKTKQETINEALKEYIRWRKQIDTIQHFGTIDFEPEFLAEMAKRSQLR